MAVHDIHRRAWAPEEVALVQQVASRCWESIERARIALERIHLLALAENANRAKDEFLAMLGHELRNPLSPILTALQLMKLRGDTTSERERTVIERQVTHLTRLVDDLLDVSRIARGKVKLAMRQCGDGRRGVAGHRDRQPAARAGRAHARPSMSPRAG